MSKKDFFDRWVDKELYAEDPVRIRLGIIVKGLEDPKQKSKIDDFQRII